MNEPAPLPPMLVSVEDAARLLSVGRTKIYELIGSGDLDGRKAGKSTRIVMASIHQYVENLPRKG